MAKFILIDTSQRSNHIADSQNCDVVEVIQIDGNEDVTPQIDALIQKYGKPSAVAVNYGPGSYTGLRIGVSLGKGLCYGMEVPMICVNSLEILCGGAINDPQIDRNSGGEIWAMLDARRMEVWGCGYDLNGVQLTDIKAFVVDENSFVNYPKELYLCGSGAEKCVPQLQQNGAKATLVQSVDHVAKFAEIAHEKYTKGEFADIAYLEPLYAKEWQTAVPQKK